MKRRPIKSIALPPADYDTTAAAMFLKDELERAGRPDLAKLVVKNEKTQRDAEKPKRKRKQVLYTAGTRRKIELYQDIVRALEKTK